jgi:hypothetical protein
LSPFELRIVMRLASLLLLVIVGYTTLRARQTDGTYALITVAPGDWGTSSPADIQAVLSSAAASILRDFPVIRPPLAFVVTRSFEAPYVSHQRHSSGAYQVHLDSRDRHWAQLVFQFGHELGHVLAGYRDERNPNMWFEEMMCETIALHTLRQVAREWRHHPPFDDEGWRQYASSLSEYASQRLSSVSEPGRLDRWYWTNAEVLRENPTARELNIQAASVMLRMFEADPGQWAAIRSLNVMRHTDRDTFSAYLQGWHDYAPVRHRAFVRKVATLFGARW